MNVYICCPNGDYLEYCSNISRVWRYLKNLGYNGISDNNNDQPDDDVEFYSIYHIAKSIENISRCRIVYFCGNWLEDDICRLMYQIAVNFGMLIIVERNGVSEK